MSLPTPNTSGGGGGGGSVRMPDPREFAEFEGPLIELAQRSGGDLRKLLTAFFGFLHRRTDFYCVAAEGGGDSKMGFKEGDAEKLLLAAFRQFPLRKIPSQSQSQLQNKPPPPEKTSSAADQKTKNSATVAPEAKKEESAKHPDNETEKNTNTKQPPSTAAKTTPQQQQQQQQPRLTAEGKQIPVGNGGTTERYTWTQTLEECTVLIGIPENVRARDLLVEFKPEALLVRSRAPIDDNTTEPRTFAHGSLSHRIVPGESTWTLEGGVLVVVLYKQQKLFWERVLQNEREPPIDTTLVDSRRHIQTYDESTQAQIRKIVFEQQQRQRAPHGPPPATTADEPTMSGGGRGNNNKPVIPPLPPGVEYIDQEILDEKTKGSSSKKTSSSSKP